MLDQNWPGGVAVGIYLCKTKIISPIGMRFPNDHWEFLHGGAPVHHTAAVHYTALIHNHENNKFPPKWMARGGPTVGSMRSSELLNTNIMYQQH